MSLLRPLFILAVALFTIFLLLIFVLKAWGYANPSSLLAYVAIQNRREYMAVLDFSRGVSLILAEYTQNTGFSWSEDGQLAFNGGQGFTLYLWDGAAIHTITPDGVEACCPQWSSDGRLAFSVFGEVNNIYVRDGETATNISESLHSSGDRSPTWSWDGRLALSSTRDGNSEIYVWDGRQFTNVSQSPEGNSDSTWSSQGQLAFISIVDNENYDIIVWDGTTFTNITPDATNSQFPRWSLDGRLAFTYYEGNSPEVYIWDGQSLINVSQHPSSDGSPEWSDDGRLAFRSHRDGNRAIYVWDGVTLTNISHHPSQDDYFNWSHDGHLAFISDRDGNSRIYVWDGTTTMRVGGITTNYIAPVWWSPP